MDIYGDVLLIVAKERIAEAEHYAARRRALRAGRTRTSARVALGTMLIRIGCAITGQAHPHTFLEGPLRQGTPRTSTPAA